MNPDSLDVSIQTCLRVLYSPFEVTAPTVLDQLFQVIDGRYHGDALQCLTDFLIPARHLLEAVQQAACAPYSERVFCCAGWPLCLHERVVIHPAPINPLLLRPGDFFLQVVPFGNQAAQIVIQSLLEEEERELEETPIHKTSYTSIFTENWLNELNAGRHGTPLARCILKTQRGVVKVPWEEVANPEFEETTRSMAFAAPSNQTDSSLRCPQGPSASTFTYSVETRIRPAKDGIAVSLRLVDSSREGEMDPALSGMRPVGWVSPNTWDSRSKSRFVGNRDDLAKEAQGTWSQPLTPLLRSNRAGSGGDRTACVRTVRFAEDPCTPCMQRKHGKGTKVQECRYRKSYTEKPINSPRGPELSYEPLTDHRNLQKPAWETPASCSTSEMCQQSNSGNFSSRERTQDLSQDNGKETVSFTPPVVGTSEKCHIVIQGQTNDVDRNSYLEMIPRLHVVPGRKAMTFGLVSPKVNRRQLLKQDDPKDSETSFSFGPQISNISAQNNIHNNLESSASTSTPSPLKADALLYLGIACLTGGQDRSGRAVLEMNGDHQVWSSALISSQELCKLLLYLHIISRKKMKDDGMTIVFDARTTPLHPELIKTLPMVQEINPHAVHWVLLLLDKDSGHIHEKRPPVTVRNSLFFY